MHSTLRDTYTHRAAKPARTAVFKVGGPCSECLTAVAGGGMSLSAWGSWLVLVRSSSGSGTLALSSDWRKEESLFLSHLVMLQRRQHLSVSGVSLTDMSGFPPVMYASMCTAYACAYGGDKQFVQR
jgi:hypothetical protein